MTGLSGCRTVVEGHIEGWFYGFEYGTAFTLRNGQVWEQISFDITVSIALQPRVTIYSSGGRCLLKIDGIDRTVTVALVEAIRTWVSGAFDGLAPGKLFALANGQIWEQTDVYYQYHYAYRPAVAIFRSHSGAWKLKVDGISRSVGVQRVR